MITKTNKIPHFDSMFDAVIGQVRFVEVEKVEIALIYWEEDEESRG